MGLQKGLQERTRSTLKPIERDNVVANFDWLDQSPLSLFSRAITLRGRKSIPVRVVFWAGTLLSSFILGLLGCDLSACDVQNPSRFRRRAGIRRSLQTTGPTVDRVGYQDLEPRSCRSTVYVHLYHVFGEAQLPVSSSRLV